MMNKKIVEELQSKKKLSIKKKIMLSFAAERRTKWRNLDAIDLLCHVPEMMLYKILNLT